MKVMFASVKGNKLIVKIQKGRMLAELWHILQRNIEIEVEFKTRWFQSQIFHKLGRQLMYKKVQGENENRRAYIPDSFISIWFILKSKRGTSLMESIFSRRHNYMYPHRWIKSKIFINEYNQQIYTAPNPLIVHGVLH